MPIRFALQALLVLAAAGIAPTAITRAYADDVPPTLEPKVDAFVTQYQPAENTGIAVGIVKGGQLVYFKGYGYRDRAKKLPVTARTVFAIGSNSKAFTSLAISMLADGGKADLESPLAPQLPGFAMSNSQVTEKITPVDMMSHRTGLPRHDFLWYFTPFSRFELFKKLPFLALNPHAGFGFREGFQYNNLMYMTIGVWIESLTRQTWESFVAHRILAPLEMNDTNFSVTDMQASPEFAQPYAGASAISFHDIHAVGPAGSINSNVTDLAKWLDFHLHNGKTPGGKALVSEAQHARLFKKESDASALLPGGETIGYGLGWFLSTINGHEVRWHGGNIDGFSSFVSFVPDSDLAVIVLTNENNGSAFEFPVTLPATASHPPIELLPLVIYRELLPGGQSHVHAESSGLPWLRSPNALFDSGRFERLLTTKLTLRENAPTENPGELAGAYAERAYGDVTVSSTANGLFLDYYSHHLALTPTGAADTYQVAFQAAAASMVLPVVFRRDPQGAVSGLAIPLEPSVNDIFFSRQR